MTRAFRSLLSVLAPVALASLAACAPAPIYKVAPGSPVVTPLEASQSPERFSNAQVVWGGRVVGVHNLSNSSEIQVLAYPLDSSQRPKANDSGNGRFIALMPGYVEPLDYPAGSLITVAGTFQGSRAGKVGEADYVFPLVKVVRSHVWTAEEMKKGHSNVNFGLGVGVGL